MEVHPDYHIPQPAKPLLVYRVTCQGEKQPGDLIEALVVARDFHLAIKYVKGDSRYYANQEAGMTASPGQEGQVLMARYVPSAEVTIPHPAGDKEPPAPKPLGIYKLELVKNIRQRSYFLMVVVAASEEAARDMLPLGMTRAQADQFGWNEDQKWNCFYLGTAAPEIVAPVVITAQQKW